MLFETDDFVLDSGNIQNLLANWEVACPITSYSADFAASGYLCAQESLEEFLIFLKRQFFKNYLENPTLVIGFNAAAWLYGYNCFSDLKLDRLRAMPIVTDRILYCDGSGKVSIKSKIILLPLLEKLSDYMVFILEENRDCRAIIRVVNLQ